jgi:hypothetical protein
MGKALLFSSQNTVDYYSVSLNGFFMIFSKIVFVDFIGKSIVVFLTKHCQLQQFFSSLIFFLPKLFLTIFLILSW